MSHPRAGLAAVTFRSQTADCCGDHDVNETDKREFVSIDLIEVGALVEVAGVQHTNAMAAQSTREIERCACKDNPRRM